MFILRLAPHYFAVFLFITVEAIAAVRQGFPGFVVFGYLPEWRYEALNWETAAEHVSHIILFSMEMICITNNPSIFHSLYFRLSIY